MENNFDNIKREAHRCVEEAFASAPIKYPYHNWNHVAEVYKVALEISDGTMDLSEIDKQNLALAAIFHDVGFTISRLNHEETSAHICEKFLTERNFPKEQVEKINELILATRIDYKPTNILEKIIRDADLAHIGKKKYSAQYNSLFEELRAFEMPQLTFEEWRKMCLTFFDDHSFNTEYARENFNTRKEKNRAKIATKKQRKRKKVKQPSDKKPARGIETMFRVSLRNHTNLSRIADNKANTLISVNAIIISIVLSALFPKIDNNPYLLIPGIVLLVVNISTIIMAILSVIPKTTHGVISRDEVNNRRGNLIFFGNFHRMPVEDFEWGLKEIMNDYNYLYSTLTRDLFYLGKVLHRKYIYLRVAYYTFIIGLVVSIAMFMYYLSIGVNELSAV